MQSLAIVERLDVLEDAGPCLAAIALLVGLLPAQEKAKTVDRLRRENAALRQQVKALRAQLDAKENAAKRRDDFERRRQRFGGSSSAALQLEWR